MDPNVIKAFSSAIGKKGIIDDLIKNKPKSKEFNINQLAELMKGIAEHCQSVFPKYTDIGYKIREAILIEEISTSFFIYGIGSVGKHELNSNIIHTLNVPDCTLNRLCYNSTTKKIYASSSIHTIVEIDYEKFALLRTIESKETELQKIYCDYLDNFLYAICLRGILLLDLGKENIEESIIYEGEFSTFMYSKKEWLLGYKSGKIERIDEKCNKRTCKLPSAAIRLKYARSDRSVLAAFGNSVWVLSLELAVKRKYTMDAGTISLFMTKDEKNILVSLENGKIAIIDTQTNSITPMPVHNDIIVGFYLDSKTNKLTTFSQDSRIARFEYPTPAKSKYLKCQPLAFCFHPRAQKIIYIENCYLKSWDFSKDISEILYQNPNAVPLLDCIDINLAKELVIFADHQKIIVFSLDGNEKYESINMNRKIVLSNIIFDNTGNKFFSVSDESNIIYCYDIDAKSTPDPKKLTGHESKINVLLFIKKPYFLVTGGNDSKVIIYDIKDNTKETKNYFELKSHSGAVTSLAATREENKVISGSKDQTIKVWEICSKQLLITLTATSSVEKLKVDFSNSLLSLSSDGVVIYWNLRSYSKILSMNISYQVNDIILGQSSGHIFLLESNKIRVLEFPMFSDKFDVIGPKAEDKYEYIYYIHNILTGESVSYDERWNEWAVLPFKFNTMIFYAFANMYRHMKSSINSLKLPVPGVFGDPYSVATFKNCDKCLKILVDSTEVILNQNSHALSFITQETLIEMNLQGKSYLHHFYDKILIKADDEEFPKFADSKKLPIIIFSRTLHPVSSNFFPGFEIKEKNLVGNTLKSLTRPFLSRSVSYNEDVMKIDHSKVAVSVYISAIRLELDNGTKGSIEFLQSIRNCKNKEIFKTKFIKMLLDMKWERQRRYQIYQSIFYLIFLIIFCTHLVFLMNSPYEWYGISVIGYYGTLMFLYDLYQMISYFKIFWSDAWNYMDISRIILITIYIILAYQESKYKKNLLSILALVCFCRGVSFFQLFDETRYIVQLIRNVIIDMKSFSIVLAYSIFSFTMIQIIEDDSKPINEQFVDLFMSSVGDIRVVPTSPTNLAMIILMLIINLIVLMNLLISIMSNTFTEVKENSEIANYMQITSMLVDIESAMSVSPGKIKKRYLQVCEAEGTSEKEDIIKRDLKIIKKNMKQISQYSRPESLRQDR